MKVSKQVLQYQRIEAHGRDLLALYPHAMEQDPILLCKKLRRLESQAHKIGENLCNVEGYETADADEERIMNRVEKLLGDGPAIFINQDPRGYALKIDSETMTAGNLRLHRDWGGNGIIAPEINGT